MPPLTEEFKRHLHSLTMEAADKVRDETARHKNELVHKAIQTHNSAAVPLAYSNAAIEAFRSRIATTIDSFLNALETCGIVVDGVVVSEMLREIHHLTAARHPLTFPPGVRSPNLTAVQGAYLQRLNRTARELERYAKNRLQELKIKTSPTVPAVQSMTPSQPFTIASVAPTLAALKALPLEEQAMLLLRRLVQIYPTVRNADKFKKGNILLPKDNWQIAMGFSDSENMAVRQHLLGGPWNRLVVEGHLVDPGDQGFHDITPEGFAAVETAAKPETITPSLSSQEEERSIKFEHFDRPVAFVSYSWETDAHKAWVLSLATRLVSEGGVNVILDHWYLHYGMDKTVFMEDGIEQSDFVLVICTREYARKANKRRGGVGYEAMIITGELAEDILTKKFIPVLRAGEWDKTSMPRWLKTKTGADLRGIPYSEEQFKQLVRELHGEYLKPPATGPKPDFSAATHAPSTSSASPPSVQEVQSIQTTDDPPRPQNAIAYAFYETKGPDAQRFKMYMRPVDPENDVFSLETSDGEPTRGTFYAVARDFVRFDRKYVSRGYIRTHIFNGTGRKDFEIP